MVTPLVAEVRRQDGNLVHAFAETGEQAHPGRFIERPRPIPASGSGEPVWHARYLREIREDAGVCHVMDQA